jgi:acetate kinase
MRASVITNKIMGETMRKAIMVINAGSSSIKFSVFVTKNDQPLDEMFHGQVEGIGTQPHFIVYNATGSVLAEKTWDHAGSHTELLSYATDWIDNAIDDATIVAVGHRVVHGGSSFAVPTLITPEVTQKLETLIPLAPLHQPHNLSPIYAMQEAHPELPQVACFDTAFHRTNPELAQIFALPKEITAEGVRRYGFHGLSYEYIATKLAELDPALARGRVVVAHLGNGASMCAIQNGQSVASTMGFTALDGLPMGTRTGALDAGVVLYMLQQKGWDAKQIEQVLYKKSGLLGVSGISNDMRVLEDAGTADAKLAMDLFAYRINRELGSLMAAMGGLDGLVFTAGIGEHSAHLRKSVADLAKWTGLRISDTKNDRQEQVISKADSPIKVMVMPTNEELVIARHCAALI